MGPEAPQSPPSPDSPAPAPGGPPAPQGGGASQLISSIQAGLTKLVQGLSQSPQVDDSDREAFSLVLQAFEQAVEGLGGEKQGEKPAPGPATMEAGASGAVPMRGGA